MRAAVIAAHAEEKKRRDDSASETGVVRSVTA